MAVAFAATLIHGPAFIGPDLKCATYSIQWANAYTAGGDTMDLSGEFDFIYGISAPTVEVIADSDAMDSAVLVGGTYDTTDKGYPAATVKLAGYNGGTEVSGDQSGIASYIVTVFGK